MKINFKNFILTVISKLPGTKLVEDGYGDCGRYHILGMMDSDLDYYNLVAIIGLNFVYRIIIWPFAILEWAFDVVRYPGQTFPPLP